MLQPILFSVALIAASPVMSAAAEAPVTTASANFQTCPKPVWPRESLRKEQTGTVTLSFRIGEDGTVLTSRIVKSSGFPLLDEAAQSGISLCKFRPATVDGKAIAAWAVMQYVWSLEGPGGPDASKKIKDARVAAARGEAEAQFTLGGLYSSFGYARRDPVQAADWYRKAAEQGHPQAQLALARSLTGAGGGAKNAEEAAVWFRKAALQGDARAQLTLALALIVGSGVEKNRDEGMHWLRKSAGQGLARAQGQLATQLMQPGASQAELEEAIGLLKKSAAQDDRASLAALGNAYEHGHGVARDAALAAGFYKQAAELGDMRAQVALLAMHQGAPAQP